MRKAEGKPFNGVGLLHLFGVYTLKHRGPPCVGF